MLVLFLLDFLHLQPILKGLSGDADHVTNADCLKRSGVGELIAVARPIPRMAAMSFTVYVLLWGIPFSLVLINDPPLLIAF